MSINKKIITSLFLIMTITACCEQNSAAKKNNDSIADTETKLAIDKSNPHWKTQLSKPPLRTFKQDKNYFWELQTTQGNLTIQLFTNSAPMHVSSTIYLTELGFYDDLTFHRVIPGFMAQGGDPVGNGTGNPGYQYEGEFEGEIGHSEAGMLSMANSGPGTDGSQFFITFIPTPFLDGKHTVFGKVISDVDNSLMKIEALGSRRGRTTEEVKIIKASIRISDKEKN